MLNLKAKNDLPFDADADMLAAADGSIFETVAETAAREKAERQARALANRAITPVTITTAPWLHISTGQSRRPTALVGAVLRIAREQGWSETGDDSDGQVGLWEVEPTAENLQTLVTALNQAGFAEVTVKEPETA